MKISELIKLLEQIKFEYGDIEVEIMQWDRDSSSRIDYVEYIQKENVLIIK